MKVLDPKTKCVSSSQNPFFLWSNKKLVLFPILFVLGASIQCSTTSHNEQNQLNLLDKKPADYRSTLKNFTKNDKVYKNFETKFLLNATYISKPFQNSLNKKLSSIYEHTPKILLDSNNKLAFFVSIHTPNEDKSDLKNEHYWNITSMLPNGKSLAPSSIHHLNNKIRWKTFFPYISLWSHEYLVVFDLPLSQHPTGPIKVKFSNLDASSTLTWTTK